MTGILGWGGAVALVLAAAYLIQMAIDSGWLTPERQVGIAAASGLMLIASGWWVRKVNPVYASALPAAGIVILYLSAYGAHLYYGLIDAPTAVAFVIAISTGSLMLSLAFASELTVLYSIVGSYSAPLLLPVLSGTMGDLTIYFSVWSVVFCIYAIWSGKRRIYMFALYLALIGFDIVWRFSGSGQWMAAVLFHAAQFVIFTSSATWVSIRRGEPMTREVALMHIPALLIFYGLEYSLLKQNAPEWAPAIAGGSALALALLYGLARTSLRRNMEGAQLLLGIYTTLVLLHAGYFESLPIRFEPWAALVLAPLIAFASRRWTPPDFHWPVWIGCGLVFLWNYVRAVVGIDLTGTPPSAVFCVLFAFELYAGYAVSRKFLPTENELLMALLVAGHVTAMAGAANALDSRFAISAVWGLLALACLTISLTRRNIVLGNSSLLVYAVSAGKVFLFDLAGAAPLVRVGCLVALGVSLYVGGLLYHRVNEVSTVPG